MNEAIAQSPRKFGFWLDEKQMEKLNAWMVQKSTRPTGAIGGRYTYSFSPTTLGVVCKVSDSLTGDEVDLSDYENW